MQGLKGQDLVKICSMYDNYKFRTTQRLLYASSQRRQEEAATQALGRTVRRREQIGKNYRLAEEANCRNHPTGKLQIRCGEEDGEASAISQLRRCRIGDGETSYRHADPPLMVTSNKLPPIFKQIGGKKSGTPAEETHRKSNELREAPHETQEQPRDGVRTREDDADDDGDDDLTGAGGNGKEKKAVSFGGARIVDDRRLTKGWSTSAHYCRHLPNHFIQLKYPSSRYQQALGEEGVGWNRKVLLPRRGRLHVRFAGKRGRPINPATAHLRAEGGRGIQPTHAQPLPPGGVSILKPAKPVMVIPTPCFPCSPEFERTFKSLRGQKK